MGMTVRLSDGRVIVTVEGVEEAKRIRDGQPEPPVAELLSGPDLLLIAQLVKHIKTLAIDSGNGYIVADCEQIQKELTK